MEIFAIIAIFAFVIVAVAIVLLRNENSISNKGERGERRISEIMRNSLPQEYIVFDDLMFENGKHTTQIDHIIVSPYGIFVIETKNYSGAIYGSEDSNDFTQYLGNKKHNLYNPIKQNVGHINMLYKVIGKYKYISLVIFLDEADLNITTSTFVGYKYDAVDYIKSFYQEAISAENISSIIDNINRLNIVDEQKRTEHIENVKQKAAQYKNRLDNGFCPRCGRRLVRRKGKNGMFMGCSNYPNCNFSDNISNF